MRENNSQRSCFKFLAVGLVLVGLAYLILVSETGFRLRSRLFVMSDEKHLNSEQNVEETQEHQTEPVVNSSYETPTQVGRVGSIRVSFELSDCGCQRTLNAKTYEASEAVPLESTACSVDAYHRGIGQNIVSYIFYGDINSTLHQHRDFFGGIEINLIDVRKFYPGFVMRLYYEKRLSKLYYDHLCKLACNYNHLDLCDVESLPGQPMKNASAIFPKHWRAFPTLDAQVDVLLSRDLDSGIIDREAAAVQEWLKSDKDFHFMRDHPSHDAPVMAGMWGVKLTRPAVRDLWKQTWANESFHDIIYYDRDNYGADQAFLAWHVWPWAENLSMSHDSYQCQRYPMSKPFPTQRQDVPNNFVASITAYQGKLDIECPVECRPKDHQDWIYC